VHHHRFTNVTGVAVVRDSDSGGHYKSKLERHGFVRWLMRPDVKRARLQRPCIHYRAADGEPHRYTGDLLVEFLPSAARRPLVVEFKYSAKLRRQPELKALYAVVEEELNQQGFDFLLQTESDVHASGFKMMKFVFGYRNNDPNLADEDLLKRIGREPGICLRELVQGMSPLRGKQLELVAAIWRLVALHQARVDFSKILDLSAKIEPAPVLKG
jgi:hypothetical protein